MALMMRSMIEVADNSGARKLQMIMPLGGSTGLHAGIGDVITASVKEAAPDGQVQKGKVVKRSSCGRGKSIAAATARTSASIRTPPCSSPIPANRWARAYSARWRANCARGSF